MEAKKSNPIKVFLYISVWVIIWGTIGSLVDFPLYKNKIYLEGSIYQYLTFTITAVLSIISAKVLKWQPANPMQIAAHSDEYI